MQQRVFNVSEVNQLVKQLIEGQPELNGILVRGELSNYKVYPSGHHYFTLKDGQSALRCVLFAGSARYLRFRPENGMKVVAAGRVSVYPRDGAYQLYCTRLVSDGIGDLHIAFEQLKQKLYAQGLFAPEHKKPLPSYPRRIAIITSPAGAAVHDMIRILGRRYPLSKVLLLPVRVQGEGAAAEIAAAIRYANRYRAADLLIVGRGGGSIEDLWAFNEEVVARAVYDSAIPVISAVGHEPDVTISDYAADRRASTPSNAAEIAVPDQAELRHKLQTLCARMCRSQQHRLDGYDRRLRDLQHKRVLTDPMAFLQDRSMQLDRAQEKLLAAMERVIEGHTRRFTHAAASLDALSPLRVLHRGYCVAQKADKTILRSSMQVEPGESIFLQLAQGDLQCQVTERGGAHEKTDL